MSRRVVATLGCAAVLLTGCGGGSGSRQLTVSAAASLKPTLTRLGGARYQFGGSDILAAQIEQGARPDVFAAANTTIPASLFARGLVERPVDFVANRLVIAVPAANTTIHGLTDLERPGVTIAIGSATVPIGVYTRKVLARLGPGAQRILGNVRSDEPDVSGIVGKLTQGAATAGFTYVTDVAATHGALRAIPLPPALQPTVLYAAAVVRGTPRAAAARRFVAGLASGAAHRALLAAGFLALPGSG